MTEEEWESIEAGSSIDRIVYVKNTGDSEVTLSLLTDHWDPVNAIEHMMVSWNYDEEPLKSGAIVEITLTQTVEARVSLNMKISSEKIFLNTISQSIKSSKRVFFITNNLSMV